ncbi:MAG: 23S rRNA (uracil(1939)-C(5))-methyltransferase RlmD [Candidatus Marinimicrobia bacterium]|nr:23S rRNA (uracil(1939)-C(5))-methyltransferase RlmD [Candidatus Neomarinimicrobiota bacterium]MDD5581818.1 23S rRNA (uracil(1939)-C(5))-methyltransferase RlmD [Candidatus Neomarinimicrobiota bacterium]
MSESISTIKKNSSYTVTIESLAFGGKGIARLQDFVIFVRDALPGQQLRIKIIRKKKQYAEAIIEDILCQSPHYIQPPCPYFQDCGGCILQNLEYSKQLSFKEQQVREIFAHLGRLNPIILPTKRAPEIWGYRNKMEFSAGTDRWYMKENDPGTPRDFAIGLHAPRRFDKILDLEACLLQDDERNQILQFIRNSIKALDLPLYNAKTHEGYLRNIVIRKGYHTGEIMVNFVTRDESPERLFPLVDSLLENFPNVTTIVNNINNTLGMVAFGKKEILLAGSGIIHDRLGDISYEISANSFFQTNTKGAEQLYRVIEDFVTLTGKETVWDLYCGTGSIALYLSQKTKEVFGFEVISDAISNARRNAEKNHITNCHFFEANLDKFFKKNVSLIQSLPTPDIVIVDPPRAGLHPDMLKELITLAFQKIIYVSCNPSTQARDCAAFVAQGYILEKVQPVDMFPHTAHIESVTLLKKA